MKRNDCLIIVIFMLLLSYMAALTFTSPYPNGTDVWFHILVARAWYKGLNGMISPVVMEINSIPYPPLFHMLLAPFAGSLDQSLLVAKVLQLIFYPVGVLAWMLLIRRYADSKLAFIFGLAITGTYFSFSQMQSKPESLTMLLLPIAIWFFMEKRTIPFIFISVIMFSIYSPYSLAFILGMLLYALRLNWKSPLAWGSLMLSSPMPLYQLSFINESFIDRWISQGDKGMIKETAQFVSNPIGFLVNGFGLNLISFLLIPYSFYKWREETPFTKVMLATFLGMLIVWPIWSQRTFSLIIVPCAFITALYVQRIKNKRLQQALIMLLVIQAVLFMLSPVWWMSPIGWLDKYW